MLKSSTHKHSNNIYQVIFKSNYSILSLFLVIGLLSVLSVQTSYSQVTPNPTQQTPQELRINSIEVVGLETRSPAFIIATSGLTIGETILVPGEAIGQAIRRLFNTGLFSDVKVVQVNRTSTEIDLEIRVVEEPRLERFDIVGPRRSQRRDLREKLPLPSGFVVTESARNQSINIIKRYFEERGYRNTEVEIVEVDRDELRNRVSLEFRVDRGQRIQIRDITFEGNESFSDRRLRRSLREIKRTNLWRSLTRQTFDRDSFEEAQENLLNFYRSNGFRDIRIVEDSVFVYQHSNRREGIGVFMRIEEGPQYFVRNIEFEGNTVFTEEQLLESLDFEKGDVFDEERFMSNVQQNRRETDIFSRYYNTGYVFFQIEEDIRVVEGDSLDIFFTIVEDEQARFNRVDFVGNTKTNDHVVRRNLRTVPGQLFSRSSIQRSIRELAQLGYFVPENIMPNVDTNFEDKTVDIFYTLDESTGSDNFELSGGFGGRQLGVILSARVNFNNFSARNFFDGSAWRPLPSGDGQRLSLGVQLTGTGFRSYNFGFQEPWMFGRPNSFGINASYSYLQFRNTNERFENLSVSTSLGRRLTWPDDFFTQFTILRFQLFDTIQQRGLIEPGRAYTLSATLGIERNSTDMPISPTSGSRFSATLELAPPLPGFQQFYQGEVKFTQHIPIVGRLVASSGFEYGYLGWFSDDNQSQYQRYFLGGTALQQQQTFFENNVDLKGFPGGRNGSISPIDGNVAIGGRIYSKYVSELRIPAVTSEQIQLIPYVFFEAGNSYRDFNEFDPFNVKRSVGFGTRIFLPILGLIDLSYGYRLDGIPGTGVQSGQWEFLFNIGSPF